ncbi:MAG: hypothetical protein JJ893_16390, partial [Thalassospira sp.]|nr:hypothetical protein [Thalassospira sp.]
GHALGLGHPGEGFNGAFQLSTDFYGDEYTIMDTNFASVFFPEAVTTDIFPSTFMYLDILALQHLYGVNETATSGDDTYRFDLAENHYLTIFDTGGSDTLRVTGTRGSTEADSVIIDLKSTDTLGGRFINVGTTVTYFDENNAIVGSRKETVYLSPETVIENVVTAAGNDIIVGNDENNLIRAGSGDDIVVGDAGADTIVGGLGHDIIAGGSGDDVIWAGAGDEGNDTVSGDDGNDVIAGGGGNDTIGGGAGSDTIFGGTGNDFVAADGIDNGTPTTSDKTSNTLWAGAGNDTVAGADGSDVLGGGSGDDLLIGAAGDDTVFAGKTGEDTITGGDGNDMLFAGTENDTIDAGAGADTIFGGAGDDVVKGGDGNDSLYGGAGDDTITGGVGADSFFFGGKHGNDIVTDFNASQDVLILTNAQTDFTDLSTVQAASSETTVGGQSGLMIDTGDGSSVFLVGLSLNALTADMLIL